ncbi:hypothetical protein MUGA111182_06225 [Mucilaginibacter galii]|uniref:YkuD domain-containing protein n=1 Tax=Mucilaginibacter galii TaxID=2005073 RepID=A0A917N2C5_9SPHI|nr:hypothetical protein [Mucilaginibacter galii]GGI51753.1 hypothetical protein GCM10011425_29650 [Mucilaginibacter galii]
MIGFAHYSDNLIALYGIKTPDKWLFNDFGHVSIKYSRDNNYYSFLNTKEHVLGDIIQTIPGNEAISHYNYTQQTGQTKFMINSPSSHGCIHIKPDDVDTMLSSGYLNKGQTVVVHAYSEAVIPGTIKLDRYTLGGYEAHFFPGLFKIGIYKVA